VRRGAKIIPFPKITPPPAPDEGEVLVEVRRCRDQAEALVVRGLLESEGVPTALRGILVHSVHPFSVGEQAELGVLVHRADVQRATDILARPARPAFPSE